MKKLKNEQRKGFNFLLSYYDVYKRLPDSQSKEQFITAICEKQFFGIEPNLSGIEEFAYASQKHSLDKSRMGWEDVQKREVIVLPSIVPSVGGSEGGSEGPSAQEKEKEKEKEQHIEPFEKRMVKFLNWFNHEFTRYQKPPTKFRTLNKQAQDNLKKLFNSKYTQEEWVHAFGNMIHNQWVIDNKTATPDHFLRVANFEKYLNQEATYTKVKKFKFPHS